MVRQVLCRVAVRVVKQVREAAHVRVQLFQLSARQLRRRSPCHLALQRGAHLDQIVVDAEAVVVADEGIEHERIEEAPVVHREDRSPLTLLDEDKPLFLEQLHRFWRTTELVIFSRGRGRLGRQLGTGRVATRDDLLDEGGHHQLTEPGWP